VLPAQLYQLLHRRWLVRDLAGHKIEDVNKRLAPDDAADRQIASDHPWLVVWITNKLDKLSRHSTDCDRLKAFSDRRPQETRHSRVARSSIASNTGPRSPDDELMTCRTSVVAVFCSRASASAALHSAS